MSSRSSSRYFTTTHSTLLTGGEADIQQRGREDDTSTRDHQTLKKFYEKLLETDEKVQRMKRISKMRTREREREHEHERAASRAKRELAFLHHPRDSRSKSNKSKESHQKLRWNLSHNPKRSNSSGIIQIKSEKAYPFKRKDSGLVDNFGRKEGQKSEIEINSPIGFKNTLLENVTNANLKFRAKRTENINGKSPTGISIENENIIVEFDDSPKIGHNAKMYAKCPHAPKPPTGSHEKEQNHPFFKSSEHHDNILDQFIKINFEQIDLMSPSTKEKQIFKEESDTSTTCKHTGTPKHDSDTQKEGTTENTAVTTFTGISNYGNELIGETDSNFNKYNDNYSDLEYDNDENKLQSEESEDLDQKKLSSSVDHSKVKKKISIEHSNAVYANRRLLQIDIEEDKDMNFEPHYISEEDLISPAEMHLRKKRHTEENVENNANITSLGNQFNKNHDKNAVLFKEQTPSESRYFAQDENLLKNSPKTRTKRGINDKTNPFDQITSSFMEIEKTVSKFIREISKEENIELEKTKEKNIQTEKPLNNESIKGSSAFESLAATSDKASQSNTEWFESIEKMEDANNRLGKLSQDYSDYGVLDEKKNYNMYEEKKKNQQESEEHKKTQRSTDNFQIKPNTEAKQEVPRRSKYFYLKYQPEKKEADSNGLSKVFRQHFQMKSIQLDKKAPRPRPGPGPSSISNSDASGGYESLLRLENDLHSDEVRDKRHPNIAAKTTSNNEEDGKEYFKLEDTVKTSSEKSIKEENSADQNYESRYKTEDLKEINTNLRHTFKSRSLLSVVPHDSEMTVADNSYFGNVTNAEYSGVDVNYLENSGNKVDDRITNKIECCNITNLNVNREFNNTKCCPKEYHKDANNSCKPGIINESTLPEAKNSKINKRSIPRRRRRDKPNFMNNNHKYIKRNEEPCREKDNLPEQQETVRLQVKEAQKRDPEMKPTKADCSPKVVQDKPPPLSDSFPQHFCDRKCWLKEKWCNVKEILHRPAVTIDTVGDLKAMKPMPHIKFLMSDPTDEPDNDSQDSGLFSKVMSSSTPKAMVEGTNAYTHQLQLQDWDNNEGHTDWSKMTKKLKAVCDLAAKEVRAASRPDDARSARDGTGGGADEDAACELQESSELMQELVRQLGDLVDYQVQRRVCRRLPDELQKFLLWLTDPLGKGPAPHVPAWDRAGSRGSGARATDQTPGPQDAVDDTDDARAQPAPAEYEDTIRQLRALLREYDELSEKEKSKMNGVRSYISAQIDSLQQLMPPAPGGGDASNKVSMEDLKQSDSDGAERCKRNVDKTLAVSKNITLAVTDEDTRTDKRDNNPRDNKPKENQTKEDVKIDKEKANEDKPNDTKLTPNKIKKKSKHFHSRRRRREGSYNPRKKSERLVKHFVNEETSTPHSAEE